jgi:hypothetical protein
MHLFFECRFARRIWADISTWLAEPSLHPDKLETNNRWSALAMTQEVPRRGLKSVVIFICSEVWMECNTRIFNHAEAPSFMVTAKIRDDASMWTVAGAKHPTRLIGRV